MIPLPTVLIDHIVLGLQKASTETACVLFRMVGMPVLKQGFQLSLPGLDIEVAEQCSGIRSALSLFITGLLASHLFLQSTGRKMLFTLMTIPIAIFKNAVRIVTISWLGIRVNRDFLYGDLHRRGGIPFALLSLAMMGLLLLLLSGQFRFSKDLWRRRRRGLADAAGVS